MEVTQELIDDKASDIYQWLQDAVGDIAFDTTIDDLEFYYGKKGKAWAKTARGMAKEPHRFDWRGWFADVLYNDVDTLIDLMGDRVYDAVSSMGIKYSNGKFKPTFNKILEALMGYGHVYIVKACKQLMKEVS